MDLLVLLQWVFFVYFAALNTGYLVLNVVSFFNIRHYMDAQVLSELPRTYTAFKPPITILVPAYNEEATITASVRSLLQLTYDQFEVIVINDGSKDQTLEALRREFQLEPFPEAYWVKLPTQAVRGIWRSRIYANLRVIDKENGGKADALNAGINASRYPLFCAVDADSVLQRNSLQLIVEPFIEDSRTIAAGGTIRIVNGCTVREGFLVSVGLPKKWLPRLQIVEYLRAFLFGRMGWSALNAMLVISGAFGLFRKSSVITVGGYRTDTVGEDMELVVRLHHHHRKNRIPYRIVFVPDPICWTEAPESLAVLKAQRARWQRGLSESLSMNMGLLFSGNGGWISWGAFPFTLLFEWFGVLVELSGYAFMIAGFWLGIVSGQALLAFALVSVALGVLLSVSALVLEEMSFHLYSRYSDLARLFLAAILENFGYRQMILYWRFIGMLRWMFGPKGHWGAMPRSASWQSRL
ncbi:MAG: glycosyltransferase family 2 protein [Betaproteobacteria bacterium]|nr:glycosyltransferase family 2 protein [Betaproteobacteria bacterium]